MSMIPQAAAPDEISLEDAVQVAVGLHREGRLEEAEELYRRILEVAPEQPETLHFLGLLARQRGKGDEALELMRRAIGVSPDYASAHNNLGNLLIERGEFAAALAALRTAQHSRPEDAVILNNIGAALRGLGDLAGARGAFERALGLAPDFALPHENLGLHHYRAGDIPRAHEHFCRAVVCDPTLATSNVFLGMALVRLGRREDARAHYRKWTELEPDNPVPPHMLATVTDSPPPPRASDGYVRQVFDDFASSFDIQLRRLEYRAPELIAAALGRVLGDGERDILDAGCGTGLCGPLLRPRARRLDGVDLSPRMLDRARATGAYDGLEEGELTAYLSAREAAYDAVVSADTLCYFGDLAEVARAAARALRPGGWFVFSVEAALDGEDGFVIGSSGRYRHAVPYLSRVLAEAGFASTGIEPQVLRKEAGEPVHGHVAAAMRPPAAG